MHRNQKKRSKKKWLQKKKNIRIQMIIYTGQPEC